MMSSETSSPTPRTEQCQTLPDGTFVPGCMGAAARGKDYCTCKRSSRAELQADLAAKDEMIDFLKAELKQLANFNPDWDMLKATRDSLRRHMRELATANERIAELERDLRSREEGGEWVSRCDHEDELAELRELADHTKAAIDERDEAIDEMEELRKDSQRLDKVLLWIQARVVCDDDHHGPWPPTTRQAIDDMQPERTGNDDS